jgi:MarR family transcriptional regulator, organic hydroperoxide resistance regulator
MPALRDELRQRKPFDSLQQEAHLSISRTEAVLHEALELLLRPYGITPTQYNVLRILRGAGDAGLPTLAIRDRMVEEAAGITRLLDKLESAGHVIRERSTPDRRQVLCHITPKGEALITTLDGPMDAANQRAGSNLDDAERQELIELLGAIRAAFTPPRPSERAQGVARVGQPPR